MVRRAKQPALCKDDPHNTRREASVRPMDSTMVNLPNHSENCQMHSHVLLSPTCSRENLFRYLMNDNSHFQLDQGLKSNTGLDLII